MSFFYTTHLSTLGSSSKTGRQSNIPVSCIIAWKTIQVLHENPSSLSISLHDVRTAPVSSYKPYASIQHSCLNLSENFPPIHIIYSQSHVQHQLEDAQLVRLQERQRYIATDILLSVQKQLLLHTVYYATTITFCQFSHTSTQTHSPMCL